MTIREISTITGLCPQTIREINKNLRKKGYWIIGNNDGMHITHDFGVMQTQAEKLLNLADEHRLGAEGMTKANRADGHDLLTENEKLVLSLLPELKDPHKLEIETPEEWRTEFQPIEVRDLLKGDHHV